MKTYFVDSFTREKFKGNPAAVCFPETILSPDTMQLIAAEIGFSETAFLHQIEGNHYSIRFFTPKIEIPLCGHATLAASKVIFDSTDFDRIQFTTHTSVTLDVEKIANQIKMQFPIYETEAITVPQQLLTALGIAMIVDSKYNANTKIILLEIDSTLALKNLQPDFGALVKSQSGINGVLVTAKAGDDSFDFHYRYFWPWAGTLEDPVTGGVQTFLTKYWANKLNKTTFNAFQSSQRTGEMRTELTADKVWIFGEAVTVLEGHFNL